MTDVLALVQAKLDDSKLNTRAAFLVSAALLGDDELTRALDDELPDRVVSEAVASPTAPSVYLRAVRVAGFRGVGPEATLELEPGPGLTVVVGRNGSGKSSFAEAVEFAFTGSNRRWHGRSVVWREGWRNLHQPDPARIELELAVEGRRGVTRLVREWKAGADLNNHESWVQPIGEPRAELATTGWQPHLDWYRPFLPYNELGAILDQGPTSLYDAMTAMLGLDHLVAGQQRLKQERVTRRRQVEQVQQELEDLRAELTGLGDERARLALDATSDGWDLDALEALATGRQARGEESELPLLRQLASLTAPDLGDVSHVVHHLRLAAEEVERVRGSEAARARESARLLQQALDLHAHHQPDLCPVCGEGRLDESWRLHSQEEVGRLMRLAEEAEGAHRQAEQASRRGLELLQPPPAALGRADQLGIGLDPAPVLAAYEAWLAGRELYGDLAGLAEHLETAVLPLLEQVEAFRKAAADELDRRESAWRPVAVRLASWLEIGRQAVRYRLDVADLDAAERWLKLMSEDIRDERFAPIAHRAQEIWRILRLRSNVELGSVKLEGASTRRRVALDVTVDGVPGAALSVMSQGELHALALSLFLPRATLEDSAFRFVVIDDPVQSMDPARVDGLARVLEDTAIKRQVVVFTHDDRLAESVRRLGVPARILEVTRGSGSAVEVRPRLDPVERYLDDARAVAATEGLPERLAGSVVPAFCRMALEAACSEAVRRRRLQRGQPHAKVEQTLLSAGKLNPHVALALFDDPTRGGEVLSRLNNLFGRWAGDVFQACNRGAHIGYEGDLPGLIRDAGRLAEQLRSRS